jgi:hypothetical protein
MKIKKSQLFEIFEQHNLSEGLFDTIMKAIVKGKIKAKNSEIKQVLISKYGSWENVPSWRKEYFGMD